MTWLQGKNKHGPQVVINTSEVHGLMIRKAKQRGTKYILYKSFGLLKKMKNT